ncbi:MAG: pitrilysin family protein [Pseudomonadota bacterium]
MPRALRAAPVPILCAIATFWALALPVMAKAPEVAANPAVTTFTLDNGMDAVVIEDTRAPVVTHMVWYRVGSADEPWGDSGIAHFFEHMMFRGSENYPEGVAGRIIAENGGSENAFTSYDYTAYFQRIAADRLDLVMGLEADRIANLIINDDVTATERKVILEERNQRTDTSPQQLFAEQMRAALFLNHPYAVPVIGWRHEIEQLSTADLKAFYDRFYTPDNAILVVAGDVDPAEVKALAEKHYGPLKPSGNPPQARPAEPPQLAPRRMVMDDPKVRQPYVMRLYKVPSYASGTPEEAAALHVLSEVLGIGISSRFAAKLQLKDKTAISTGSWYSASARDASGFGIWGVPTPGTDLSQVEADLDEVIAELAASGPTEEELDRVKRKLRAARIFAKDSVSSQANLYGRTLSVGLTVEDVDRWPAYVEAVTAEDVAAAANKHLNLDRSVTGWLMREEVTQ